MGTPQTPVHGLRPTNPLRGEGMVTPAPRYTTLAAFAVCCVISSTSAHLCDRSSSAAWRASMARGRLLAACGHAASTFAPAVAWLHRAAR